MRAAWLLRASSRLACPPASQMLRRKYRVASALRLCGPSVLGAAVAVVNLPGDGSTSTSTTPHHTTPHHTTPHHAQQQQQQHHQHQQTHEGHLVGCGAAIQD